jgi:hypothetical protein
LIFIKNITGGLYISLMMWPDRDMFSICGRPQIKIKRQNIFVINMGLYKWVKIAHCRPMPLE